MWEHCKFKHLLDVELCAILTLGRRPRPAEDICHPRWESNHCAGPGVVLLDEHFMRAKWPMWELGIMMAALPDHWQAQPDTPAQAARAVLPVVLMDFAAVTARYEQHWQPAIAAAAAQKASDQQHWPTCDACWLTGASARIRCQNSTAPSVFTIAQT